MFITGIIVGALSMLLLGFIIIWRLHNAAKYSPEDKDTNNANI